MGSFSFGQRGDFIKDIQSILTVSGLYQGRVDGQFGPKTLASVKSWQSTVGEKPDGIWGPRTAVGTARYLARFNDRQALANGGDIVIPMIGGQQ